MSAIMSVTSDEVLAAIEGTLRTEIIDVFRSCLDRLTALDRGAAYETVMNEPEILHQAFDLFRCQPDLFSPFLVDERGQNATAHDDQLLRCGDTLGHVKALILRAAARRHFRRTLGGPRSIPVAPRDAPGLLDKLKIAAGLGKPPPQRFLRLPGRGDTLYRAIRNYLRFDWQARLLPAYSRLTPELIGELGATLLEIREPAELTALTEEAGQRYLESHGWGLAVQE